MYTGDVEYRNALQQYAHFSSVFDFASGEGNGDVGFTDSARNQYIPSSQALSSSMEGNSLARADMAAGNGTGVQSSGYPWAYLPPPVKQQSDQSRQLYDSIYSLPLMSSSPKYPALNAYDIHDSDHSALAQGFEASDGLVGVNSMHNGLYKASMLDEHVLLSAMDSDFANRTSTEGESLPSWENSPRSTMAQLTVNTAVPTTQPSSSFVSASMGYNDISAYSDIASSTSAFTPCSSLYFSNTPLSPASSPQRQQYSDCLRVDSGPISSTSPRPRGRQLSAYSYDGCGSGWTNGSSSNSSNLSSTFLPQNAVNPSVQRTQYLSPPRATSEAEPMKTLPVSSSNSLPSINEPNSDFITPSPKAQHAVPRVVLGDKPRECHDIDHYSDLTTPPDLLKPLREEQLQPPPEDMFPSDPSMVPREQELRFDGDLYTPTWVRGHGNKREGWCGICKPGRWLILKNSAYWYDKSFTHGISATTGQAFSPPKETRRTEGNANIWEGLCENCDQWVGLVSSKKRGTTWFRHAYKCYNNSSKAEGTLKRRRASTVSEDGSQSSSRPRYSPAATSKVKPAIPRFLPGKP
ncbi:uncharacterized protein GIQ15_01215 [Arthroderma uncinatum]|uniref:uncharacterized protein n=1 Tax=Arthroderma uncinatum TaxID=74035 RepID=UPI00144A7FF7|nr:uncharacterized protein GIQ15_01215 [Arthroderma uncinatum]KAF3491698.1 hypothetical protein GIQ15_01215 [Arthroderma uncinatum]